MNLIQDAGRIPGQLPATGGTPSVSSIVNNSGNPIATRNLLGAGAIATLDQWASVKMVTSGALTANTLATVLSITGGGGFLKIAGVCGNDVTSRTHRMVITIDGTVAFDNTSAALTAAGAGILPVGNLVMQASGNSYPIDGMVRFNTSLLIQYASSVTETGKSTYLYSYTLG